MSQEQTTPLPPSGHPADLPDLTSTPRPLSEKALRRAWVEPTVGFWCVTAVLLAALAVAVTIGGAYQWYTQYRALRSGVRVEATIYEPGSDRVKGHPVTATTPVRLLFEYRNTKYQVSGYVHPTTLPYETGQQIPLYINPDDPETWTDRSSVPPIWGEMVRGVYLAIPAILVLGIALVRRWLVLQTWRHGELVKAKVLDHSTTAVAPRSAAIRCAAREGKVQKIITIYLPQRITPPAADATVELIRRPGSSLFLLAANYQ